MVTDGWKAKASEDNEELIRMIHDASEPIDELKALYLAMRHLPLPEDSKPRAIALRVHDAARQLIDRIYRRDILPKIKAESPVPQTHDELMRAISEIRWPDTGDEASLARFFSRMDAIQNSVMLLKDSLTEDQRQHVLEAVEAARSTRP